MTVLVAPGGAPLMPGRHRLAFTSRRGTTASPTPPGRGSARTCGWRDVGPAAGARPRHARRTVVCIPTPGHTPGHHSLRVRTEFGGEFVLCGDACYLKHSLDHLALPGVIADRDAVLGDAATVAHAARQRGDAHVRPRPRRLGRRRPGARTDRLSNTPRSKQRDAVTNGRRPGGGQIGRWYTASIATNS